MDGHARAAGAGLWFKDREGKDYYLSGAIITRAEVEQYLLSMKLNPIDAVMPEYRRLMTTPEIGPDGKPTGKPDPISVGLADWLRSKAYDDLRKSKELRVITQEEVDEFRRCEFGQRWVLWRMFHSGAIEKGLPLPTMEQVLEIIDFDVEESRKRAEAAVKTGVAVKDGTENGTLPQAALQVTGEDLLGNSTGQTPSTERSLPENVSPSHQRNESSLGGLSTAVSLTNTVGLPAS